MTSHCTAASVAAADHAHCVVRVADGTSRYRAADALVLALVVLMVMIGAAPSSATAADPALSADATVAASATTAASTSGSPVVITDARGKQIGFATLPQRLVVTGKASFQLLDALYLFAEGRARVCAIGKEGQGMDQFLAAIDPGYASKTFLGREAGAEAIAATKPDVVLMKSASAEGVGKTLEALGIPVVCIDFETPAQYERDLQILGQLLGQEERAKTLIGLIHARLARIEKALAGLTPADRPKVLLLYYSTRDGTVTCNVAPKAWIQTLMVGLAGGQPVWEGIELGKGWTKVGFEQVAAWNPDRIIVVSYFTDTAKVLADLLADPRWQELRAVKEKKLWAFPGDMISWDQPDPRWLLGLTWMAAKLHPARFPGIDMRAEAVEFFKLFYGVDPAIVEKLMVPTLHGDL